MLGGRLGLFTGGPQSFRPRAGHVIQVDIEGEEIGRNRDIQLGIVADCREALRALIAAARRADLRCPTGSGWTRWRGAAPPFRASFQQVAMRSSEEPHPPLPPGHEVNALPGRRRHHRRRRRRDGTGWSWR